MQYQDYRVQRGTDTTLSVKLSGTSAFSGQNISGQGFEFVVSHRLGNVSGFFTKSAASGYNNVSGINVLHTSGKTFDVSINAADTSGLCPGNHAYATGRTDSGSRTVLQEGFILLLP